jgi:hypothetical protein
MDLGENVIVRPDPPKAASRPQSMSNGRSPARRGSPDLLSVTMRLALDRSDCSKIGGD